MSSILKKMKKNKTTCDIISGGETKVEKIIATKYIIFLIFIISANENLKIQKLKIIIKVIITVNILFK